MLAKLAGEVSYGIFTGRNHHISHRFCWELFFCCPEWNSKCLLPLILSDNHGAHNILSESRFCGGWESATLDQRGAFLDKQQQGTWHIVCPVLFPKALGLAPRTRNNTKQTLGFLRRLHPTIQSLPPSLVCCKISKYYSWLLDEVELLRYRAW
jgi:hypothetical protein